MSQERKFEITWVSPNHGAGPAASMHPDRSIVYGGKELRVTAP
jgi:hypothetical protein